MGLGQNIRVGKGEGWPAVALGVAAVGLEGLVQAIAQRAVCEHADLAHVEAKAVVAVGAARAQVELVAQLQVLALVLLDALEIVVPRRPFGVDPLLRSSALKVSNRSGPRHSYL